MFDSTDTFSGAVACRIGLNQLTGAGPISRDYFKPGVGTMPPVSGATGTMDWASPELTTPLRVCTWPESVRPAAITAADVTHASFGNVTRVRPSRDTFDACAETDSRVLGGWLGQDASNNSSLDRTWSAAQGASGLGTFPYPQIRSVRIAPATLTLVDEPAIYSASFP